MSGIVTLHCTTTIDGRQSESTIAVPRAVWNELPEDLRKREHARVRAMHARQLQAEQGVTVDPSTLVVTVGSESLGRPDAEPTPE